MTCNKQLSFFRINTFVAREEKPRVTEPADNQLRDTGYPGQLSEAWWHQKSHATMNSLCLTGPRARYVQYYVFMGPKEIQLSDFFLTLKHQYWPVSGQILLFTC